MDTLDDVDIDDDVDTELEVDTLKRMKNDYLRKIEKCPKKTFLYKSLTYSTETIHLQMQTSVIYRPFEGKKM